MELKEPFCSLFAGELLFYPARHNLVQAVGQVVDSCFGQRPEALDNTTFRHCLGEARKALGQAAFRERTLSLLDRLELALPGLRLGQLRLRAVSPGLQKIPAAQPVFYAHRDTWYGNPRCQINLWMPLHDVHPDNSFRFYLDYFHQKIPNDSVDFKAERFRGFGQVESADDWCYPKAQENPGGKIHDVCMKEGEVLLFSAAHLHQTLPNRTEKVRFSVDARFFLEPHLKAGLGAPDPDNASSGLLIDDYLECV